MTLARTISKLKRDYPRLRISAEDLQDHVWLFNIEVEADYQNQGIGTAVIQSLQKLGKPIALFPLAYKGKETDLERFYRRLGFQWECDGRQLVWRNKI